MSYTDRKSIEIEAMSLFDSSSENDKRTFFEAFVMSVPFELLEKLVTNREMR